MCPRSDSRQSCESATGIETKINTVKGLSSPRKEVACGECHNLETLGRGPSFLKVSTLAPGSWDPKLYS